MTFGLVIETSTKEHYITGKRRQNKIGINTDTPSPAIAHRAPPDPTVLNSKLDQYPDGVGNSALNRGPRQAEDPKL